MTLDFVPLYQICPIPSYISSGFGLRGNKPVLLCALQNLQLLYLDDYDVPLDK